MSFFKKFLLLFLFLGFLGGGLVLFLGYQKYQKSQGIFQVTVFPPHAIVNINNKLYTSKNGFFRIKLEANKYHLIISSPGYSVLDTVIEIQPQKILDFHTITLSPKHWLQEELITDSNIFKFFFDANTSHLIYFKQQGTRYDWYLYERNTKETTKFLQTSTLPQEILFPKEGKTLIARLDDNNWQVVFLPKSLLEQPLSLNKEFLQALKQNNLQTKQAPSIFQVAPLNGDNFNKALIVRTNQGLYLFNYLDHSLQMLINTTTSPFLLLNNNLYYIKNNGLLMKFDLDNNTETSLSLNSFVSFDDNLNDYLLKKAPSNDLFLIITSKKKAYLLNPVSGQLLLLQENILDGNFTLDSNSLFLFTLDKKIIKFNILTQTKEESEIIADSSPFNLLDHQLCFFARNNNLLFYNFQFKAVETIADDLKNNNFVYDPILNYIFYLSPTGIKKISF